MKCLLIIVLIFLNIGFSQFRPSSRDEVIIKSATDTLTAKQILSAKERTDSIIHSYASDPVLKNAKWGFCVYNPKTNKVIISKDENQSYIPASTTKLITTETALSLLGENFKWKTQIDYSGTIDSFGNLNGNLYLVSNNDPTLGYKNLGAFSKREFFNTLIEKIKNQGIKKINGNLITEIVVFKSDFSIPMNVLKIDHGNYFSIPNNNYGCSDILFYVKEKEISEYNVLSSKKQIEENNRHKINKNLKTNNTYSSISLSSDPIFLAKEFKNYIIKFQKLQVNGTVTSQKYSQSTTAAQRTIVYTYESPALKNLVHFVNQTSNNHFAEQLLNSVGYFIGKNSTRKTGISLVINHLNKQKFDTDGLSYADGSGLSRSNYITPIAQVKYLANIMKKPFFKVFFESLPKAGETGTLKKMFVNSIAIGKLRAKTGTLSNVKALTGYLDTKSGERLCFSLLVNNFSGTMSLVKKRMETLLESVIEY